MKCGRRTSPTPAVVGTSSESTYLGWIKQPGMKNVLSHDELPVWQNSEQTS